MVLTVLLMLMGEGVPVNTIMSFESVDRCIAMSKSLRKATKRKRYVCYVVVGG